MANRHSTMEDTGCVGAGSVAVVSAGADSVEVIVGASYTYGVPAMELDKNSTAISNCGSRSASISSEVNSAS